MKDIVIVGSGGFAKEVKFLLKEINRFSEKWNFIGYIDKSSRDNEEVIGDDNYVLNSEKELHLAFGIGDPILIAKLSKVFAQSEKVKFPNLIHPNVIGDWQNIEMGMGNIICASNTLTTDITIGNFNILNLACTVGHDARIGSWNVINPTVNISGGVEIGNGCLIGTGAQILQNLEISDKVLLGAGSVLTKSTYGSGTYFGIPAKKIK
ncbi:MAG: transferase [Flavobacteriales bacterium]|nr:transferase [Flavobacteriales bacterium]|tara:strand:+ start:3956 stop:4579 length:624 start_codon:yes stop_codon:yes gene_type:complete